MAISPGGLGIQRVYVGDTALVGVYLGSSKLWAPASYDTSNVGVQANSYGPTFPYTASAGGGRVRRRIDRPSPFLVHRRHLWRCRDGAGVGGPPRRGEPIRHASSLPSARSGYRRGEDGRRSDGRELAPCGERDLFPQHPLDPGPLDGHRLQHRGYADRLVGRSGRVVCRLGRRSRFPDLALQLVLRSDQPYQPQR
ncbi:hypothetical protein SEA_SMAIRT_36 [Mycobacterium phage Smairt]|nr:hypothetical protein SEA_SMAIRT_36 [Mycobacterium phage Smairt]